MYQSCLLIDVGDNPDRPRPGRLWLRNIHHVHQRLCMAFPSAERKADDADFLKPYKPCDFASKAVHTPRSQDTGFLFRIDPHPGGRVVILVQSAGKPDWDYAFHNAGHLLAAPPSTPIRVLEASHAEGQRLRFRLVANPTRRLSHNSRERDGQPVRSESIGMRVPVPNEKLEEWLEKRAEPAGFRIEPPTSVQAGYVYVSKNVKDQSHRLRFVQYDGILQVTDADLFRDALIQGIGPAKAYGCGLLSVAPMPQGDAR